MANWIADFRYAFGALPRQPTFTLIALLTLTLGTLAAVAWRAGFALQLGPADLSATIFHSLGINPKKEFLTPEGRPIPIVPSDGEVIEELFA